MKSGLESLNVKKRVIGGRGEGGVVEDTCRGGRVSQREKVFEFYQYPRRKPYIKETEEGDSRVKTGA